MASRHSSGDHSSVITRLQSILSVRYDAIAFVQSGRYLRDATDVALDSHGSQVDRAVGRDDVRERAFRSLRDGRRRGRQHVVQNLCDHANVDELAWPEPLTLVRENGLQA